MQIEFVANDYVRMEFRNLDDAQKALGEGEVGGWMVTNLPSGRYIWYSCAYTKERIRRDIRRTYSDREVPPDFKVVQARKMLAPEHEYKVTMVGRYQVMIKVRAQSQEDAEHIAPGHTTAFFDSDVGRATCEAIEPLRVTDYQPVGEE